jgi:hypothetical protein
MLQVTAHSQELDLLIIIFTFTTPSPSPSSSHINNMYSSVQLILLLSVSCAASSEASRIKQKQPIGIQGQNAIGHNDLFHPNPTHPIPYKIPFEWDEEEHYYEKHVNGSENGYYRRSSCPAMNALANRGYINRSGRNISYEEIAQATRVVWNFGDDNVRSIPQRK